MEGKCSKIVTNRNHRTIASWQLVYEWEDVLAERLGWKMVCEPRVMCSSRVLKHLPALWKVFAWRERPFLYFDMKAEVCRQIRNARGTIPYVIDFCLSEEELAQFPAAYGRHPLVIISSREVYECLEARHSGVRLAHVALSLSDKYALRADARFEKKYDLVLVGRQNPVLMQMLGRYVERHPDFVYVKKQGGQFDYDYITSDGRLIGNVRSRADYIRLLRQARCAFYSTPGIDGGEDFWHGFSPVTPRFLEYIACGCHVIARWRDNADTQFYELGRMCRNVQTYEEFEALLDKARVEQPDLEAYAAYLEQHYTSRRAEEIKQLLL